MNTDKIKNEIRNMQGANVLVKINIGRNRFESVFGVISDIYPYLFTIKTNEDIKTFSFVDVLTKNVVVEKVN